MDVERLAFSLTESDLGRCLKIEGYTTKTGGVYVLLPLMEIEREPDPVRLAKLLVVNLQNAFDTMAWIYAHPDEAAAHGTTSEVDAAAIKGMKVNNDRHATVRRGAADGDER